MSTTIDLSLLPAPAVVQALDYQTILSAMLNGDDTTTPPTPGLLQLMPSFSALLESDPAYKILEVCAYRELLIRQRVNDAAQAVMLAHAVGTDLDNLGVLLNVTRNTITPANPSAFPPVAAVMESDTAFRARIQLSLDGFSTAGPIGAYRFWALSAAGTIADVSVVGPPTVSPGQVLVTIMSNSTLNGSGVIDGTASSAEIAAVTQAVNADTVRPLTDQVTVQGVTVTDYSITATIYTAPGPDSSTVMANAQASAQGYVTAQHKVGRSIHLSALYAALFVPGISNVVLTSPTADISIDYAHTAFCTAINLTYGGIS